MANDIRQEEVLLLTDRSGIKTKTNVYGTNKPSTKSGHLHLAGLILAQSRTLRRDMAQMETRLRGEVGDLRDHMERIEGTLNILRQFFLDHGCGSAA